MDIALQRHRREWLPEAICSDVSEDEKREFYPEQRGRPPKNPRWKKLCNSCPVRLECLNYAIVHNEPGNWGGSTEAERKALPQDFVEELIQIAKSHHWYEDRFDPWKTLAEGRTQTLAKQLQVAAEWETEWLDDLPLPDSVPLAPQPLSFDQQRSLELLGFY